MWLFSNKGSPHHGSTSPLWYHRKLYLFISTPPWTSCLHKMWLSHILLFINRMMSCLYFTLFPQRTPWSLNHSNYLSVENQANICQPSRKLPSLTCLYEPAVMFSRQCFQWYCRIIFAEFQDCRSATQLVPSVCNIFLSLKQSVTFMRITSMQIVKTWQDSCRVPMPAGTFGICLLWKLSQACAFLNWITSVQNGEEVVWGQPCKTIIILDMFKITDDIFLYKSWEKHCWTTYHHSTNFVNI